MIYSGYDFKNNKSTTIYPWEIEIFALHSIYSNNEYDDRSLFDLKGSKIFNNIIGIIRNYEHPKLVKEHENVRYVDYFMIVAGLTQFSLQENIYSKYYRYKYIFNFRNDKVNIYEKILEKFNTDGNRILEFGYMMHWLFSNPKVSNEILEFVILKYKDVFEILYAERTFLLDKQNKVINEISDSMYGFKFFYQYPFIRSNNNVYLPLPHVLLNATTSSIIYRITEDNNEFRAIFGKEVLEEYLYHVLSLDSEVIDIKKEYKYKIGKQEQRTLDVMIKYNNGYILFDSKSYCPSLDLRILNNDSINKATERVGDFVVQVYKHVKYKFNLEYTPFIEDLNNGLENTFGVVLLFEDNYIRRKNIYDNAAKKLNLSIDSDEYNFLCSNIKILSLASIEKIVLSSEDIIDYFISWRDNRSKWFDFEGTMNRTSNKNIVFNRIFEDLKDKYKELVDDLVEKKIIPR